MNQEKIGKFIGELRRKNNLTQAELGEQVGVTGKAVSRWERGLRIPDVAIINKVSEVLGITTTELLNGEKLGKVNTNNIDEITENSIDFYKEKLKKKFRKILLELKKEGKIIIIASHDKEDMKQLADIVYKFENSTIEVKNNYV